MIDPLFMLLLIVYIKILFKWGGRWDSNPRSPEPQSGALNQLGHAHRDIITEIQGGSQSNNGLNSEQQ
tara:strand:+ start:10272 stop:10475 length:204 start_codon:yes stop_codon:yes gene_type:complete